MTTMIGPLSRAMQVAAERPAVTCGDLRLSYAETWYRCRRLAGALRARGRERGRGGAELPPLSRAVPDDPGRRAGDRAAQPAPHRRGAALRAAGRRRTRAVRRARGRR